MKDLFTHPDGTLKDTAFTALVLFVAIAGLWLMLGGAL